MRKRCLPKLTIGYFVVSELEQWKNVISAFITLTCYKTEQIWRNLKLDNSKAIITRKLLGWANTTEHVKGNHNNVNQKTMSANTIQHIRGNHPEAPTDRRPSTTSFHRSGHLIFNTTWLWVSLCDTTLKQLWDIWDNSKTPHLQHNLTVSPTVWDNFETTLKQLWDNF